jgi:hypothetical protein
MSIEIELLKQSLDMLIRPYSSREESDKANILIAKIQNELEKPEPEPLAWMYDVTDNDDGSTDSRLHFYKPLDHVDNIKNVVPLYASPQQNPLSEKEILDIFKGITYDAPLIDKVRAIEKAHDIGVN